ncbi:MAG: hypothetical protein ACI4LK_08580 [Lentihominibacter sp.]
MTSVTCTAVQLKHSFNAYGEPTANQTVQLRVLRPKSSSQATDGSSLAGNLFDCRKTPQSHHGSRLVPSLSCELLLRKQPHHTKLHSLSVVGSPKTAYECFN